MYKTIRHGENSLQYTILPQNDDFRLDGKLSNSGHKSKRGGRKRSCFAYFGLIFICTVIIGAILLQCLPNPSDWFLKAKVVFITRHSNDYINLTLNDANINSKNNNINRTQSTSKAYLDRNQNNVELTDILLTPIATTTITTTVTNRDITTTTLALKSRKKVLDSQKYDIYPTSEGTDINPISSRIEMNYDKVMTTSTKPLTTATWNSNKIISTPTTSETNNRNTFVTVNYKYAIDDSELRKKVTKKPIILPVLAKTNSIIRENGKLIEQHTEETHKNWIRTHWPFVDPSTYFQWTGYKREDSVLLPAILGLALIGLIAIIALCVVVRHKNRIVSTIRKRNKVSVEDPGEDNTNLLTTGNISDDD